VDTPPWGKNGKTPREGFQRRFRTEGGESGYQQKMGGPKKKTGPPGEKKKRKEALKKKKVKKGKKKGGKKLGGFFFVGPLVLHWFCKGPKRRKKKTNRGRATKHEKKGWPLVTAERGKGVFFFRGKKFKKKKFGEGFGNHKKKKGVGGTGRSQGGGGPPNNPWGGLV